MRTHPYLPLLLLILIALFVTGCASTQHKDAPASDDSAAATRPTKRAEPSNAAGADTRPSSASSVQSIAQRLKDALSRSGQRDASSGADHKPAATQPGRRVRWRDAAARSRPNPPVPDSPTRPDESAAAGTATTAAKSPATQPDLRPRLSRDALSRLLIRQVRSSGERPMRKAVAAVGLSLVRNESELNADLLSGLDNREKKQVTRFHQVTRQLAADMLSGAGRLNRKMVVQRVRGMFNQQPISIRKLELCKNVEGYGVYTPFADHRFLAGQPRKMIVYVELDHFKAVEKNKRYEVKLKQEIMLFNESDGLTVWSNEPVTIHDRSRNKRRDFFTVQLVTLPARLSVGKYRLKVRITDLHGGSVDETSAPVELVADRAIADGRKQTP